MTTRSGSTDTSAGSAKPEAEEEVTVEGEATMTYTAEVAMLADLRPIALSAISYTLGRMEMCKLDTCPCVGGVERLKEVETTLLQSYEEEE